MWNLIAELDERGLTDERAEQIIDLLEGYHPAVGLGTRNRPEVTISLPATDLRQAVITGLAVIEAQTGSAAATVEVLSTAEFDEREGLDPVPDLLSVTQVAAELGQSRQAVLKAIDAQRFTTATRVGDTWAIARSEVERRKAVIQHERERVPFWYSGVDLTDEQRRVVFDPMYDALRIIGTVDAYRAYIASVNRKEHNEQFAEAWRTAHKDAVHAIGELGFPTNRIDIRPAELPGPKVGAQ